MIKDKKIIGRECRFVVHVPKSRKHKDIHVVKELLHYEDGTTEPNLNVIMEFKRPFYITKEHYRDHKDKKEHESLDKLNKFYSTQSDLANSIATRLGYQGYTKNQMRDVIDSPFVYGVDISSTAIIKKMYLDKFPQFNTPYSVCALDIENDPYTEEILVVTIAMHDKVYTPINKKLVQGHSDVVNKLNKLYETHIPDSIVKNKAKVEFEIFDTEIEVVRAVFDKLDNWMPDFVAIWKILHDIPIMMRACDRAGVKHEDVFCTNKLPKEYKRFAMKKGATQRTTESGKTMSIDVHKQWHWFYNTASFWLIDAMSSYTYIRAGSPEVPGGYSLDNILSKTFKEREKNTGVKMGKLVFDDIPDIKGLEWHLYMVKERPLEYIIYNQWDTMSMVEMDMETNDLSTSLPMQSFISDFNRFNSGPKKIIDAMHFFFMENEKEVIGIKQKEVEDNNILGLNEWIITLPAYLQHPNGMKNTTYDDVRTYIRGHANDSDAVSSYPSNTAAANISKSTTKKEIIEIEDIDKDIFKLQNINLIFGDVNAIEYCNTMFNMPSLKEIDNYIKEKRGGGV